MERQVKKDLKKRMEKGLKTVVPLLLVCVLLFTAGCSGGAAQTTTQAAAAQTDATTTAAGADAAATQATTQATVGGEQSGGGTAENLFLLDGTMPMVKDPANTPHMKMLMVCSAQVVVDPNDFVQTQKLNTDTGLVFDWIRIPEEGQTEKLNLMIASRDLPDVFWNGVSESMVVQYMDQDVFLPTEDLTEKYMPRLTAVYQEAPQYLGQATAPDGHRYGFPYIEEMYDLVLSPGPYMINQTWLDKVGKQMPTTVEEYTDVLRAFKAAGDLNGNGEADEYALAFGLNCYGGWGSYEAFQIFTGAFGEADVYSRNNAFDHTAAIDGKIVYTAMDDSVKETAKYFHMLESEGLIDPLTYSPHPSGLGNALYRDTLKGDVAVYGSFPEWAPVNDLINRDVYNEYAVMPRLTGPNGKIGERGNYTEMHSATGCAVTTVCPYPEAVAVWVDYLFEPEIAATTNHGPLGINYIKTPEGRLAFNLKEDGVTFNLLPEYDNYATQRVNVTPVRGSTAILNRYYDEFLDYNYDAVDIRALQLQSGKEEIMKDFEDRWYPVLMMQIEEQATISQIKPQLDNIVNSYKMQWILDGGVDETWDQYKSELEAAGVKQYTDTLQGAYDRYVAAMG
ncbi:MAG: extracellular solute-binding protein [Clostridiales bacterium]|nr:extracellular solute-binding protein [Clostridiales bacterium]